MIRVIQYIIIVVTLSFSFAYANESQKYQLYFWANYNQRTDNPKAAQECYDILFKKYACPELYPGYLTHLAQTNQHGAIVRLLPIIESTIKKDLATQLIFIQSLQATGKFEESLTRIKKLTRDYPDNPEVTYYAATMLAEQKKFQDALEQLDSYLKRAGDQSPKAFIFYFLKGQIYSRMGNNNDAIIALKKSLELFPEFDQALLLLGLIYEMMGDSVSALTNYQTCSKLIGPNPMLERQIMHLQLKIRSTLNNNPQEQLFNQITDAYQKNDNQRALALLHQSGLLNNYVPARLLYLEIMCKTGNCPQALKLLTQWALEDPTNDVWYHSVHLLYKAGIPFETILGIYDVLEKKNPTLALPLLYKADIYLREGSTAKAREYLNKALKFSLDPLVKAKILFQLGRSYYLSQEWNLMLDVLKQAQQLNQPYAPVYNLLAYYYATQGKNLAQAETLIKKALEIDKNPHYLDTYALIMYKQNKIDEADRLLEKLVQQLPNDHYVQYHYAKVLHKKGMKMQALDALKKALQNAPESEKKKYQQCHNKWATKN